MPAAHSFSAEPTRWPLRWRGAAPLLIALVLAAAPPAHAWTAQSRLAIANQAARIAPADLARQIERHPAEFQQGALTADGTLAQETRRAIEAIRQHQPFAEVAYRAGRVSALAAAANDPLAQAGAHSWAADFRRYIDSARPRFRVVFYGGGRAVAAPEHLPLLVERAADRGAGYLPFLDEEYRRIGGPPGRGRFDDRSTAFGIAAVAFSHAVSDAGAVLRYLWIEAGGADPRPLTLTPPAAP